MAQSQMITQSDAQTIGWELTQRTPDNQLDVWQRLCYQLERALPPDSISGRWLGVINEALCQLRLFPCPYIEMTMPVSAEEAVRLITPEIALGFDNIARVQSLLHDAADQLGNHPATIPLYAIWDALDMRSARLIHELTYGQQAGAGEDGLTSET